MTDAVDLGKIRLSYGSHSSREEGMCLMEAVAFLAGEPHTDRPQCVCPTLAAFGRSWNDALDDEDRNRLLKRFIPRLIGTRSTPEVEQRRAYMATDWAVRVAAPVWLRAAGLEDEAGRLEALAPMTSADACRDAMPAIRRARHAVLAAGAAAGDAAGTAAGDAARAAAWDAAGDAGMYAARTAARAAARAAAGAAAGAAAWYAARAAAGAAAGAAAWYAARAAARAAGGAARPVLRPSVEQLQASALDLYERMIEVRP